MVVWAPAMFLTVTLNPALDKSLVVNRNEAEVTIRALRAWDVAGGKGINVARGLHRLAAPTRSSPGVVALAPLGGYAGAAVAELARSEGLELLAVPICGQTRAAITVQEGPTGATWHYLEPGPAIEPAEAEAILAAVSAAMEGCDYVVLSGSIPSPSAAPLIAAIAAMARLSGKRLVLDAFGPHAAAALRGGAWLAKPTPDEWALTFGGNRPVTPDEQWRALEQMADWGISLPVLSLGSHGARCLIEGEWVRVHPATVREVNGLGSGDAMIAGCCWSASRGADARTCLAWGAAAGAANAAVWDPCGFDGAAVEALVGAVRLVPEGPASG